MECASGKDMAVDVEYGLASSLARVEDETEFAVSVLFRDGARGLYNLRQEGLIRAELNDVRVVLLRHRKNMDGRLGLEVLKAHYVFVFIHFGRRNLARHDFAEYAIVLVHRTLFSLGGDAAMVEARPESLPFPIRQFHRPNAAHSAERAAGPALDARNISVPNRTAWAPELTKLFSSASLIPPSGPTTTAMSRGASSPL